MERSKADRARDQVVQRLQKLIDKLDVTDSDARLSMCFSEDTCKYELGISNLSLAPSNIAASFQILTSLVWDAEKLVREAAENHYPALVLYDIPHVSQKEEEPSLLAISRLLPSLIRTSTFLSQVSHVFRNLLLQLREFHNAKIISACPTECSLVTVWRALGDLLGVFMHIDEIIRNRPALKQHWQQYFKSMCSTEYNPSMLGVSSEQLRPLIVQLAQIDAQILSGNCLRNCYEQTYGELDDDLNFANHMKGTILSLFDKWYKRSGNGEGANKRELLSCTLLAVFYHLHFQKIDKKVIKTVWSSHKKIVSFNLIGDITFLPGLFLLHEVPEISSLVDKKSITSVQSAREKMSLSALLAEAAAVEQVTVEWIAGLDSLPSTPTASSALTSVDVLLKGVQCADTLSRLLKSALSLLLDDRLSKSQSQQFFSMIHIIKNLSFAFSSHWEFFSECAAMASQQWRCHSITLLERLRVPLLKEGGNASAPWLMIQSALRLLLHSATPPRLAACHLALGLSQLEKYMSSADIADLWNLLSRLRSLVSIRQLVQRVTDCSFLIHHLPVVSLYWQTSLEFCHSRSSLQAFTAALADCCNLLKKAGISTDPLLSWTYETIKQWLLSPLHSIVENHLRILTHKHLKVDERDKASTEVESFCQSVIKQRYLRIDDLLIDVKQFLERSLQKNFYNMSVVALNDRESYCKMADLALHKFDLNLVDGHLPQHSFYEGFNPIDVMRNIKEFATRFNYCHSMQVFFEHRNSTAKCLLVLSHENISTALHVHGIGLLHTTLNVVYQFLRSKFQVIQQFMADEHIHAQLQRDARYFEENKESLGGLFPARRAEKFNKAIAKLSDNEDISFMDRLRMVITEMGNALGYARAMACAAAAQKSSHRRYEEGEEFGWIEETAVHADILTLIRNEQTTSARHFLSLFVNVFRTAVRERSGEQLRLFYILSPCLSISFIEHMLSSRDRLDKRIGSSAFVDDGFAVGTAFLLSVLEVASEFTSLNWFKSMEKKFNSELSALGENTVDGIAKLRRSRLEASMKEYRQLSLCLSSSLLLFTEEETLLV